MKRRLSRYEQLKKETIQAVFDAIKEEKYIRTGEYIVVIRNVTYEYNVDFEYTADDEWADECYDQACFILADCAWEHRGNKYILALAKSCLDGSIEVIKGIRAYLNK